MFEKYFLIGMSILLLGTGFTSGKPSSYLEIEKQIESVRIRCRDNIRVVKEKPLQERVDEYLQFYNNLTFLPKERDDYLIFTEELIKNNEFTAIEMLEKSVNRIVRRSMIYALSKYGRDTVEGNKLLKRWAIQYPDNLGLITYHPQGKEILIGKLKNENEPLPNKIPYARILAKFYRAKEILPILKKMANDETPVGGVSSTFGETVGKYMREYIHDLESVEPESKKNNKKQSIPLSGETHTRDR